jgi:hypothetical protein
MSETLILLVLIVVVAAPFVLWWAKTPKNGWRIHNKLLGHTFNDGKVVIPGHMFPTPVVGKKKPK